MIIINSIFTILKFWIHLLKILIRILLLLSKKQNKFVFIN
jgi:hypothetical protein